MTDNQLHEMFVSALKKAEDQAGRFIRSLSDLAVSIINLHQSGAWRRVLNEDGSQTFKSARAYYEHVASKEKFPKLHKTVRDELIQELFNIGTTPEGEMLIGIRELAALINADPKQASESAAAEKAKRAAEAAEAKAEAEAKAKAEALEAAAAEASAVALAAGKTEAEAEAAAEAILRYAEAEAAKTEAEAKAKAEAEAKAAETKAKAAADKKAKTGLENALKTVSGLRADMAAEDQAWVLKLVTEAVRTWQAADKLAANPAEAAKASAAKAKAEAKAAEARAEAAELPELKGAPVDPTTKAVTPAEAAARRQGRKASA